MRLSFVPSSWVRTAISIVGLCLLAPAMVPAQAAPPPPVNWNAPPAAPVRPAGQPNGQPLTSPVRPPLPQGYPAGAEFRVLTVCAGSSWTWKGIFSGVEVRSGVRIDKVEPNPNRPVTVSQFGDTAGGAISVEPAKGGAGVPAAAGEEIVTFTVYEIDHPNNPTRTVVLKIHVVECA
jgi:hypothetical protein